MKSPQDPLPAYSRRIPGPVRRVRPVLRNHRGGPAGGPGGSGQHGDMDRTRSTIRRADAQPLTTRPAVNFSAAGTPYLVGVITAATPLAPPASHALITPPVPVLGTRALAVGASAGHPTRACGAGDAQVSHEARAALAPGDVTY